MTLGRSRLGSLRRRLLAGAAVFILAALVIAGVAIGFVLHRFARGQVDARLDAEIAALAADLERSPDGARLPRRRDMPESGPRRPGWYWQIRAGGDVLRSPSLMEADLPLPDRLVPGAARPSPGDATGPFGEALILRALALPAAPGAAAATIVASAPAEVLNGPLREAARTLTLTLGLFGLALIAGVVAQVRLGLRPLARLGRDLAEVRAGRRARVPSGQPEEIAPLVAEVNGLLDQNERGLAQARGHVANLAHGLKTPLATLTMALDRERDPDGTLGRLVAGMDARVRHHLRRARAAALDGPARSRSDLGAHAADLVTALGRIHRERGLRLADEVPAGLTVACDAQDLDEMLGNLLDNACRWAAQTVRLSAEADAAQVVVRIEDDGPGLSQASVAEVVRRGRRLDESVDGDGFGLPITLELAELYGGALALERSDLGGLAAVLRLPA